MKTPRNISSQIIEMNDGKYIHFGFAESLRHSIKMHFQTYPVELKVNINIDGLPISKSSGSQFWPILGAIVADFYSEPFVIGIYHGNTKPKDADVFLKSFVEEAKCILDNGLNINKMIIRIKLNAIICDAPAKSFICGIKGHTGYFSCTKCIQEGEFINNKVVFLELNSPLRTDHSFSTRQHEEHHVEKYLTQLTSIETLGIGIIFTVPIDCMHLIFLGVNKRILRFWIKGAINIRLPAVSLDKAQQRNNKLKKFIPVEFARRPRDLLDLDRWKATEHKLFALYTGIIITKNVLSKKLYMHFTCLCVAVRIVSDKQYKHMLHYAQSLFEYFVRKFREYYGDQYLSHNVHNLLHICEDVKRFETIDSYSAFKYENYLYTIKKSLQVSGKPLEQIANRIIEKRNIEKNFRYSMKDYPIIYYDKNKTRVKRVEFDGFMLSSNNPDNCCSLINNIIATVNDIYFSNNILYFRVTQHLSVEPFFSSPCDSTLVGIYKISEAVLSYAIVTANEISRKCLKADNIMSSDDDHSSIIISLLH
ncbi:PREDICTED: uncharacterized protein LOC105450269 [Wasmannia auropunctata]|uniref:uncharacterized protein LOC105450269 n=1 Tax=Wasmannia auropunctata TaxID=64793 RepID=UPI0005ED882D|nr:PREDICTED: uncharacterized protein LOC105450269 [Wasmannia auropunctata]